MANELATMTGTALEQVVIGGDLKSLTPPQRVEYYAKVCESVGLNPLTKPFDYITLNGKLTLYARKDAADQLRKIHGISITSLDTEIINDVYCVTAVAMSRDGRTDIDTGAVNIKGMSGDNLANAMMKARTKAKRRVTLSIAGLGWLDETELETIQSAQPVIVSQETGEVITATGNGKSNGNGKQAQAPQPEPAPELPAVVASWTKPDDAYIWAGVPDYAGGESTVLFTGLFSNQLGSGEKYSLFRFELRTPTAVQMQSLSARSSVSPDLALIGVGLVSAAGVLVLRRRREQ